MEKAAMLLPCMDAFMQRQDVDESDLSIAQHVFLGAACA